MVQSVYRWAPGWTIGVLGFDSRQGLGIFLFTTVSRTALGPTHPPIQWVPGALSLRLKRPGREADHSPQSSAEIKNTWSYTSTLRYVFMAWCLVKHRDNFTTNIVLAQFTVSVNLHWFTDHFSAMGEIRNTYEILDGKHWRKERPLERSRYIWEDSISLDLKEIGREGVDWIHLAQDTDQWWTFMNTVMNLRLL
jgi:hypothetical protein